ncbi:NUDIX hydrolase [Colwellia sp. M166]|uniref:NUDIX hydrolase n=1 Tax=Colwellia sp. M166 TaxID=2583805 RepID=UPI00211F3484|nr:NUDIX hydrolase [Colwellia sp. M166]UUO22165.1 NUDIX hydrolase [Colwellia sp. M166]|tara:strand:- start:6763 stop:7287 length:525 start_codon:yes stop_codon:yes gene_type:complete
MSKITIKPNNNISRVYDETPTEPHGSEQFKPNTTVAAIVCYQDKFLLVEELEHGATVYNQPAGHLESNENLVHAIERELKEETGLSLSPEYLCGIYYYYRASINLYYLRFCFVIELDDFLPTQPQDEEIIACHWLTLAEIKAKSVQLRSPLVLECIEDYLSGKKIPLSHLKSNL